MEICKVKDCNRSANWKQRGSQGYCYKHKQQIDRCGKILERTKFDPNEFIDCGSHVEIVLYDIKNEERARALIDKEDMGKAKMHKWSLSKNGYVIANTYQIVDLKRVHSHITLHRLILDGLPTKMDIDHINHSKIDNRKQNLRLVTRSENMKNQPRFLSKMK